MRSIVVGCVVPGLCGTNRSVARVSLTSHNPHGVAAGRNVLRVVMYIAPVAILGQGPRDVVPQKPAPTHPGFCAWHQGQEDCLLGVDRSWPCFFQALLP